MASELQTETNALLRLFDKFSQQTKILVIGSLALIAAIVAVLLSVLALNDAKHARVQVEYELQKTRQEVVSQTNRTTLYIVHVQQLQARLEAAGFEVPPLPEE